MTLTFFVTLTTITGGSCHKYNFCCDKYFVATSILLLHQKMCFVATNLLSWQKLYLWQLPPMIDHSSPIFHWALWLKMMHHQTKSGCKKLSRPDVLCSHILIIWGLWLGLEESKSTFWLTFRLIMMYHRTQFCAHTGHTHTDGHSDSNYPYMGVQPKATPGIIFFNSKKVLECWVNTIIKWTQQ